MPRKKCPAARPEARRRTPQRCSCHPGPPAACRRRAGRRSACWTAQQRKACRRPSSTRSPRIRPGRRSALALGVRLLLGRVVDLLEHAWHGEHERGLEARRGRRAGSSRRPCGPACSRRPPRRSRCPAEDVRDRQEEQGGGLAVEEVASSASAARSASTTKQRWVSSQPFGRPVVPDV